MMIPEAETDFCNDRGKSKMKPNKAAALMALELSFFLNLK